MKKIITKNTDFVDNAGRKYYFHGINIVEKGLSNKLFNHKRKDLWCERSFFKKPVSFEELQVLKSMGVNLIRLGITWEGIEPEMEKYNEETISSMHKIIKNCESLGIRVLIDMHQDLYSGWGNSDGDGAPKWATLTDGIKYKFPRLVWAMGYFTGDAIMHAFDNFWNNTEVEGVGLQDRYAKMWAHLAKSFSDCSNIFGYDIFNEPFGGSYGRKIIKTLIKSGKRTIFKGKVFKWSKFFKGLFPKMHKNLFDSLSVEVIEKAIDPCHEIQMEFDKKFYNPFLNKVATEIRKVDKDTIITVDNNYFSNIAIKSGVEPIMVDGVQDANQCFSPHAYDFMIDTPQYDYANDERIKFFFDNHLECAKRLKLPVLVGEWGGVCFKGINWHNHIKYVLNYFDNQGWSRLYWQYRKYILADKSAYIFMRPYVSEIDGELLSSFYDYNTNELKIKVKVNNSKDNLVVFSPLKILEIDDKYCVIKKFNSELDIENIDKKLRYEMLNIDSENKRSIKELKWREKHLLDFDPSQLINSCFIEYSLPEGEHEITIKIERFIHQVDTLKELQMLEKEHKTEIKRYKKQIKHN